MQKKLIQMINMYINMPIKFTVYIVENQNMSFPSHLSCEKQTSKFYFNLFQSYFNILSGSDL